VADLLAERGCVHVVVDLSLESIPALRADGRFGHENASGGFRDRAHAHGLAVTENVRNLATLEDEVFFAALPLRGHGLTTSPCRPIAMTAWPSNAPTLFDVSMPLENHWRWYLELDRTQADRNGRYVDETHFVFTGHGFTHCDAPRHMERDGATIQDLPNGGLDLFCGPARIATLTDLAPATPITADILESRLGRPDDGAMIVLHSGLTDRLGYTSRRWHLEAPWLDASAAAWLVAMRPAAVVLDFPQDRVAREMPDRHVYNAEFVAHHAILGAGIPFVEDLRDIGAIGASETWLLGVPLRTACIDGAPMRVVAVRW
jgi:kynurenine formamidase